MKTLVLAAGASLILAAAASAHVTLNPGNAPADSFSRFALRVPTEEDVPTVKVSIQLPAELEEVGFQPKEGWTRTQNGRVVTWSGGQIGVGEFDEFGLSIHVPNTPGETLTFPATQTYANGKVVRWIGAPDLRRAGPDADDRGSRERESHPDHDHRGDRERRERGRRRSSDNLALGFGIAGLAAGLLALGVTLFRKRGA